MSLISIGKQQAMMRFMLKKKKVFILLKSTKRKSSMIGPQINNITEACDQNYFKIN